MTISLEYVVPDFLEKEKIERSETWTKKIDIHIGEMIQVIAPSGSGKTSLVHFLYGLRTDYKGNILFNKKDLKSFSVEEFSKMRSNNISIIFQDLRLFTEHTVFENIEIKRKLSPFHASSLVHEMAARLGISNKLNKPVKICSYGEQQRIAIIRALQQPFDYLLMDEPFSNLDENNREKAMALIQEEAQKRNATVILADLKRVEFFNSDRTLHL